MSSVLLWGAAGLATLYLAVFCYRGVSWLKTGIKTASVLLLAGNALWLGGANWLIGALVFCALGDFLLSREDDRSFLAGVGAFALGHVGFIVLFLGQPDTQFTRILQMPQVLFTAGFVILAVIMVRILWPRAGDLAVAVVAYIPIICGMGVAALTLPFGGQWGWLLPGTLLFVLSDFVLAMEMFVLPVGASLRRFTPFVVWFTYWTAQFSLLKALI